MNKTLAVIYRPKNFSEVSEQKNIISILENQLRTKTFKQAYLFCGSAGTGKTTAARIFANELNKGQAQPIELDAASNNGVDEIREVIKVAKLNPVAGEYKVFILDECHMLTNPAWNAMLKVLEEPPKNTIFIFCTTDPQKIINTVLSRVQRYNFQRISVKGIVCRLEEICKAEKIKVGKEVLEYIAKLAEGGMRDAISIMDKCLSYDEKLTLKSVQEALGLVGYEKLLDFMDNVFEKKTNAVLESLYEMYNEGIDLKQFIKNLITLNLDIGKYAMYKDFEFIKVPATYEKQMKELAGEDKNIRLEFLDGLLKLQNEIKYDSNPLYLIEAFLVLQAAGK